MADDFNQKLIRVESILMSFWVKIMEISLNAIDFKTFFLLSFSFRFVQRRWGALTHDIYARLKSILALLSENRCNSGEKVIHNRFN